MKLLFALALAIGGLYGQNACVMAKPLVKPVPPVGCMDVEPACKCSGIHCDWIWVCARDNTLQKSDLELFLEAQRNGQRVPEPSRSRKPSKQRDREYSQQELNEWANSLRANPPKVEASPESDALIRQLIQMKTQSAFDSMEAMKASVKALQDGPVTKALPSSGLFDSGLYKLTAAEIAVLNDSLLALMRTIVGELAKANPKP